MEVEVAGAAAPTAPRQVWNRNKFVGQKPPLKPRHVWAIRTQLQIAKRTRDLALFNLAIDEPSSGAATSSRSAPPTSRPTATPSTARRSGRARLAGR